MSLEIMGFMDNHLKDVIYIIGAIISFFVGSKARKVNVERDQSAIQGNELENVEAALKIYRLMLKDLQEKLLRAEEAYVVIERKLQESAAEKRALKIENKELKAYIDEITGNIK